MSMEITINHEQPKEREPMLSEAEVERILDKHDYRDEMSAMKELWRLYENLITTGKLLAVKEGDWRELDLVEEWYFQPTKCLSCGVECITAHPGGNYAPPNYCPGCGNKFKR